MAGTIHFFEDRITHNKGETEALSFSLTGTTLKFVPHDGYYNGSTDKITYAETNLVAANIKSGITLLGVEGSLSGEGTPITTEQTATAVTKSGTKLQFKVPVGLYDGSTYVASTDAAFLAGNILASATIFGLTGTIAVHAENKTATAVAASGASVQLTAPVGYYNGSIKVVAADDDFVAGNIKKDIVIFGVTGTLDPGGPAAFTTEQTATAVTKSGTKLQFKVPVGTYDGTTYVASTDAAFLAANILASATIFGLAGSVTVHSSNQTASAVSTSSTTVSLTAPAGYYSGTIKVASTDAYLLAANIKKDVVIFGVTGSLEAESGTPTAATLFDTIIDSFVLNK